MITSSILKIMSIDGCKDPVKTGTILKGIGGFYYVRADIETDVEPDVESDIEPNVEPDVKSNVKFDIKSDGESGSTLFTRPEEIFECKARGIFRKDGISPLPGDRVMFSVMEEKGNKGWLEKILDRKNSLIRPAIANVDQMIVVVSVRSPEPDLLLLDRLLARATDTGLDTVICLNKIDLATDEEIDAIYDEYCDHFKIIKTSIKFERGFIQLYEVLKDKLSVFAGQSGVGKSTILNMVMKNWLMETGSLSAKLERGKHTTRHVELFALDCGGTLADTPGFSSYELLDILPENLAALYPDFTFSEQDAVCRFRGCSHISEPDCAVKSSVEKGRTSRGRYERYVALYKETKKLKANRN
ncbi:MAG: ribosome small subunit-dependent GTPase A [Clostridiales bacterium]|nr:ribosome small subunit-dependent GTPase A [Clostridiales bacterium]